ncbi:hypothetical protein RFI_01933 [Reticulomyxa filosa]|uniref:Uncharacterized protein n=1 Tax=Reticulomyxa filosa TaxID=46433 RepID=X6PAP7_RETFI|nr:hypothetical protein RFI_01933 [Reticulomyxa filosa]|eukprot:ETO35139.1 hypothetical protein RFI_01933 [Reticulomyxa filosa]
MTNRTTTQKSRKKQAEKTEQSQYLIASTSIQVLKDLPTPFVLSQCVLYKHEIIICGGYEERACYSYHTLKNEYKFICEYPSDVTLIGHCVVKLIDNNSKERNQITLLSFGGYYKHALVMKYVSIWSNDDNNDNKNEKSESNELNKLKKPNNCNEWVPFTDDHNNPIIIGRDNDEYMGVRAVIDGSNNHLLFITYSSKNISVFDLNRFQFIKHDTLPTSNYIHYHCFVSKSANRQKVTKTNEEKNESKKKLNNEMLLFCEKTGLSITYDEDSNTFQYYKLGICKNISSFSQYAYVFINDAILFFGGYGHKAVHGLHLNILCPCDCMVVLEILSEDNNYIHIIGGCNDKIISISANMKTKVDVWRDASHLVIFFLTFLNYIHFFL